MHGAGLVGGAGRALALASARTGAREKVQGHREVLWPAGTLSVTSGNFLDPLDIFSDRSRRFPINRGRGGGRVRNFFRDFFFSRVWGGGEGGGGTPKPEARVARFLVGMFRNRFFEAGVDAKVSPKKVSPNKEAVFFLINIFFSKWNTQKVSPNWDGSKSVIKSIALSINR